MNVHSPKWGDVVPVFAAIKRLHRANGRNGMGPREGRTAEMRRAQIIAAAHVCFRASGFHSTSMAQIAAEAGLSVGQIYRYFENKEAVIAAIVEQGLQDRIHHIDEVQRAIVEGQDLASASAELSARAVVNKDRREAALILDILAEGARNPAVAKIVEAADSRARQSAHALVAAARPQWSAERVEAVVEVINILYEGLYPRRLANPSSFGAASLKLRAELIKQLLSA